MDYVLPPLPIRLHDMPRDQFTLPSSEQNIQISNGPSVNVYDVGLGGPLILLTRQAMYV